MRLFCLAAACAVAAVAWVTSVGGAGVITPPYDVKTGHVALHESRSLGGGYTATHTLTVGPGVGVHLGADANYGIPQSAQDPNTTAGIAPRAPTGYRWVEDGIVVENGLHQRAWEWHHQLEWQVGNYQVIGVPWNHGVPVADDWGWQWGGEVYDRRDPIPASSIWAYSKGRENFCIPYCWKSQYPWMNFRVNGAGNLTGDNWGVDGG